MLFDGKDLAAWKSQGKDAPRRWKVENGYMEVVKGTGAIETKQSFGDVQLHIEWMAPSPAVGVSQDRGNSGVFFGGGRYEVQVLDSYQAATYPDGQAGALYGQFPPLVNATRPPGEWQAYDIVFEMPRFDAVGRARQARAGHGAPERRAGAERARADRPDHQQGADALLRRTRPRCRSACRTTTTRCASATSGCAS